MGVVSTALKMQMENIPLQERAECKNLSVSAYMEWYKMHILWITKSVLDRDLSLENYVWVYPYK